MLLVCPEMIVLATPANLMRGVTANLGALATFDPGVRGLWIRTSLRKQGIQSLIMSVDIVKKVHRTVLFGDRSYVENKHRDFRSQVNLAIVFA